MSTMSDKNPPESVFVRSVRRASGVAWQGLEHRAELASIEFREEWHRLVGLIALMQVAVLSAFMAFLCLNVLLFAAFWNTRVGLAIALAVFYALVAAGIGVYLRWRSTTAPQPFASTIEELRKDREALKGVER